MGKFKKLISAFKDYIIFSLELMLPFIFFLSYLAIDIFLFKREVAVFDQYFWKDVAIVVFIVIVSIVYSEYKENRRANSRYYIRTRGYIGNGLVWWRPNGAGYTSDIDQAGVYTYEEAYQICKSTHGDNLAYKCSTIDNMEEEGLILQVHADYIPKPDIGTRFGIEITEPANKNK